MPFSGLVLVVPGSTLPSTITTKFDVPVLFCLFCVTWYLVLAVLLLVPGNRCVVCRGRPVITEQTIINASSLTFLYQWYQVPGTHPGATR